MIRFAQDVLPAQTTAGISVLLLYNHRRRNLIFTTMPYDLHALTGLFSLSPLCLDGARS